MPELHVRRTGNTLSVTIGEHSSSIPLAEIVPGASTWQRIYDDAVACGRDLFDHTFREEQMRTLLANLPANERVVLVADDPLVASLPWEIANWQRCSTRSSDCWTQVAILLDWGMI